MEAVKNRKLAESTINPVSDQFTRDWQYLVDLLRIPFVKQASAIIAAMPALASTTLMERLFGDDVPTSAWFTWAASVLYLLFFVTAFVFCPRFIREYRDFGEYEARKHSKRFIGWELEKLLAKTKSRRVITELIEKGIAEKLDPTDEKRVLAMSLKRREIGDKWTLLRPNNVGFDLHFYFFEKNLLDVYEVYIDDTQDDPKSTLERNIFWTIYGKYAASWRRLRNFLWFIFISVVLLFLAAAAMNVFDVVRQAL